ncbi:MAG: SLC13 family permease, partial [Candidatus Cryptobacteroides sp.]
MFKIFPGYQLVESYHEWKKAHRTDDKTVSRLIRLGIAIVAALVIWCLPLETLGIAGLTVIQKRTLAIFLFATLMWLFEAVPAWTTSVMVVVLLLFATSDSSLVFFRNGIDPEILGQTTSYKSLLHCFADPIIMLFIGGFVLAIAASKSGLDVFLARVMLKPFGKNPKFVLLGFILVTGVFSMFLSNTATAAMMLTFLGPVLKSLPADGKGKTALAMAIPIAANIGGMGTPIGTPPNAIALKYLNDPAGLNLNIGFGEWMSFMLPFTIVLLLIAWVILLKLFPFKAKTIELNIEGEVKKDWRSIVVYVTFICTVLLWVLDKYTGVNSNVVAMLPVGVFAITGVLTKRDLEEISWSVLWMVAGGFALGVALQETGLASTLIAAIPFDTWPPVIMVVGSGLICYAMANFISHTATAALLVPILAVVGISVSGNLAPLGGVSTLL